MADDGEQPSSDDLWAATRPDGSATPAGSDPVDTGASTPDPTPDPTLVQPVVRGPALPPSVPPGSGPPPGGPPPTGGPPPPGGPDPDGPPPWLLPVAAAMIGLLVIGLVVALVLRDGGEDDSVDTTLPLIGTTDVTATTIDTESTTSSPPPSSAPATTDSSTSTSASPTTAVTTTPTTAGTTTTSAPTTTTTTEPVPELPDPGLAVVDGTTVEIVSSCLVVPLAPNTADLQVVSHLMVTDEGRLVLDAWTEGSTDGLDGTLVDREVELDATAYEAVAGTSTFTATLRPVGGGASFDVAVNPGRSAADCPDTIRTRDADDSERSQYTHAILEVCTVRPDDDRLDVAGVGSEGARFTVDDSGDGTVELRFTDRNVGDLVDPEASASFDESVAMYEGRVEGGGDELVVRIEVELATPRTCEPSESP